MNKIFLLLFLLLIFSAPAFGQTDSSGASTPKGVKHSEHAMFGCDYFYDTLPRGHAADAILAKHHEYKGPVVVAQLGYIDTNCATLKEIWDNMELGLVVLPSERYEIVSFGIASQPKGRDYQGPYSCKGNKVPINALKQLRTYGFRPGDYLFFSQIRVKRNGSDITYPVSDIKIKIQ